MAVKDCCTNEQIKEKAGSSKNGKTETRGEANILSNGECDEMEKQST